MKKSKIKKIIKESFSNKKFTPDVEFLTQIKVKKEHHSGQHCFHSASKSTSIWRKDAKHA
jgi:hypothetical protein